MGKGKRNNRNHDQRIAAGGLHAFLNGGASLEDANREVREAEARLLEARRIAAQAAEYQRGYQRGYGPEYKRQRERLRAERERQLDAGLRSRPTHAKIDLDNARGQAPEDQAAAFFNRPGDYYLARFTMYVGDAPAPGAQVGPKLAAETVLKASEDQFGYLLEVLRQIRGGFGERCRIELYRTHTVEQAPAAPAPPKGCQNNDPRCIGLCLHCAEERADAAFEHHQRVAPTDPTHISDGPPIPMSEFRLGERYSSADAGHDPHPPTGTPYTDQVNDQVPPWLAGAPPWVQDAARGARATRDLTREELQAQLPGMTRAEVAAELGKRPEDIGGNVYATGDLEREKLAAEFGVPVDSLQPIRMSNGGTAYAVVPQPPAPEGRHAKPDTEEPQP